MRRAAWVAAWCVAAGACGGVRPRDAAPPAPGGPVPPAAWDALCPASGATAPFPIRVGDGAVKFEPSAAAVWDGRLAVFGDKQAHAWWWTPGTTDVTQDPAWAFTLVGTPAPDQCCSAAPGDWGSALKRQKARETCEAHHIAIGARVPWLKLEGAASTPAGVHVVGNMGFGCSDNARVLRLPAPGAAPVPLAGVDRDLALSTLAAADLRVEGLALGDGGKVGLLAVREKDDALSQSVIVVDGLGGPASARRVVQLLPPAGSRLRTVPMGLSDATVLPDGRVAFTLSQETDLDGVRVVSGELWVSAQPRPWAAPGQAWDTALITVFADHKPEAVVMLSAHCAAVLFDDDEGYKAQQRRRTPDPAWDPASAFAAYVRVQ